MDAGAAKPQSPLQCSGDFGERVKFFPLVQTFQEALYCPQGSQMAKIIVEKTEVSIISKNDDDYISLTDIARYKTDNPTAVIANWMRNRNTIEYLGLWETLYNPDFKPLEFEGFRRQAGLNAFTLSPQKWIDATGARGLSQNQAAMAGPMPTRT
jgi:hypothetical protein